MKKRTKSNWLIPAIVAAYCLLLLPTAYSQNVGINNTGNPPNSRAMLDVDQAGKGLLIPRMVKADRDTITSVPTSLLIYQTDNIPGYYYYNGTAWVQLFSNNSGWSLTGNAGTSPATNFLGTTDNVSLRFRTNNTEKMIIDSVGNVGIGITNPNRPLVVSGPWSGDVVRIISSIASQGGIWVQSGTQTGRFEVFPGSPSGISIDAVGGGENNIDFRTANNLRMRILGSGAGAGNVGIGTTSPGSKLEVVGDVKIGNSSATCNATTEGSQRYNSTTKKMEYCDGVAWKELGGDVFPTSTVIYVNAATCPAGWSELTSAQGRYIVGLPTGGTLAGTAGTALTNLENRPVGQHNHGISDPGHLHGVTDPGHTHTLIDPGHIHGIAQGGCGLGASLTACSGGVNPYGNSLSATTGITLSSGVTGTSINSATTGISINNAGAVAGTNAPYIQLRVCQKN